MATIKDVAQLAGVSIASVSNVLNGKENISDETYAHIMYAVNELNYRPNLLARSLKKNNTKFIAVLLPRIEDHYSKILNGAQRVFGEMGYRIILELTDDNVIVEQEIVENMLDIGVNGMLIVPATPALSETHLKAVRRIPTIYVERTITEIQSTAVLFDNRATIANVAAKILKKFGSEHVLLVTGPAEHSNNRDCLEGFIEASSALGDNSKRVVAIECGTSMERAFNTLYEKLLELDAVPSCFLVSEESIARALAEVLLTMDVTADIVVLSGDDWRISSEKTDNIHHIKRNAHRVGEESARLLLEYMKNAALFENRIITVKSPPMQTDAAPYINTYKQKEISVLLLSSPTATVIKKLSVGFSKSNSFKINFKECDYLDLRDELEREFIGKESRYDVCMVDLPWIESYGQNNYLYDLADHVKKDEAFLHSYPHSIRQAFGLNESHIYGFPVMATLQFLFYRKDLFTDQYLKRQFANQNGFELKIPHNWTEFNLVAQFFTKRNNAISPVEYGTSICGIAPVGLVDEFLPRQWAYNGHLLDPDGNVVVNSPGNLRALANLNAVYEISPPDNEHLWWDNEFEQLINGRYAMINGFASHYPMLEQARALGEFHNKIGVAPIPGGRPMLGGWILGINRHSERVDEGYAFIRWAVSKKNAIQSMLLGGSIPVKDIFDNPSLNHAIPWLSRLEAGFEHVGTREIVQTKRKEVLDAYWLDEQIAKHLQFALHKECSDEEALVQLEKTIVQEMNLRG